MIQEANSISAKLANKAADKGTLYKYSLKLFYIGTNLYSYFVTVQQAVTEMAKND